MNLNDQEKVAIFDEFAELMHEVLDDSSLTHEYRKDAYATAALIAYVGARLQSRRNETNEKEV